MQRQKTIRFSDAGEKLVKDLTSQKDPNYNRAVNLALPRYALLVEQLMPKVFEGQMQILEDAYRGHTFSNDILKEIKALRGKVNYEGMERPLGVLVDSWSVAQQVAVLHHIQERLSVVGVK